MEEYDIRNYQEEEDKYGCRGCSSCNNCYEVKR